MDKKVLAFDFGASSGRAIIFTLRGRAIEAEEISRFKTRTIYRDGALWWDYEYLFSKIDESVEKALPYGISGVGIDTWGCDFALINGDRIVVPPLNYRDEHVLGAAADTEKRIPFEKIYAATGIQKMDINTVNRFSVLDKLSPGWRDGGCTALMMADLFAWHLTGSKRCEITAASTTSMLNVKEHVFDKEIFKALSLGENLFAPLIRPGEIYGYLKNTGDSQIPVFAVCTHDTASAVAAVPALTDKFAYISSGTWSLMGTERRSPETGKFAERLNFTNETGYNDTVRFLKNIMGLWILQEVRRNLNERGEQIDFPQMIKVASDSRTDSYINPDDDMFLTPGDMLARVDAYLQKTGQPPAKDDGERLRIIYESLALDYKNVMTGLESVTGEKYDVLHVVGGGSRDALLAQLTADALGIPVLAGPTEATALGNAIIQFIALGEIQDVATGRRIIRAGLDIKEYLPQNVAVMSDKFNRFKQITEV